MGWRATIVAPRLTPSVVKHLLHALSSINFDLYVEGLRAPPLYHAGIRYRAEAREAGGMREDWLTIPEVLARGVGDCEDLACWRVAELWRQGELDAYADQTAQEVSGVGTVYHIIVRRPSAGITEDPSRRLGMI